MIKKIIFPAIVFIISFTACNKENAAPAITATGELIDGGNPAADGSGFFIRLDNNEELKPDSLPDSLEVPHIRVRVELTYQYTDKRYPFISCGSCPGLPIIHVITIRKI